MTTMTKEKKIMRKTNKAWKEFGGFDDSALGILSEPLTQVMVLPLVNHIGKELLCPECGQEMIFAGDTAICVNMTCCEMPF